MKYCAIQPRTSDPEVSMGSGFHINQNRGGTKIEGKIMQYHSVVSLRLILIFVLQCVFATSLVLFRSMLFFNFVK